MNGQPFIETRPSRGPRRLKQYQAQIQKWIGRGMLVLLSEKISMVIHLTQSQLDYCTHWGKIFFKQNEKKSHLRQKYKDPQFHIRGLMGEVAVCEFFSRPWENQHLMTLLPETKGLPDVGPFEVRSTHRKDKNDELFGLPFHMWDHRERPYILTRTYDSPKIELIGWAYGWDVLERGELKTYSAGGNQSHVLKNLEPMESALLIYERWTAKN